MTETETPAVNVIRDEKGLIRTVMAVVLVEGIGCGTAEMCVMPDCPEYPLSETTWWISRVLVHKVIRRKGYGKQLVIALQEHCEGCPMLVAPSGYNTKPAVLKAFYESCGFVAQGDGVYTWRP